MTTFGHFHFQFWQIFWEKSDHFHKFLNNSKSISEHMKFYCRFWKSIKFCIRKKLYSNTILYLRRYSMPKNPNFQFLAKMGIRVTLLGISPWPKEKINSIKIIEFKIKFGIQNVSLFYIWLFLNFFHSLLRYSTSRN